MEELRGKLNEVEDAGMQEEESEKVLEEVRCRYFEKAAELSGLRREAANRLAAEVVEILARLDMPSVRFQALFSPKVVPEAPVDILFSPGEWTGWSFFCPPTSARN